MPKDIKSLFESENLAHEDMPKNHQERFLHKLNEALPKKTNYKFIWLKVAASIVVVFSFGFLLFNSNTKNLEGNTVVSMPEANNNVDTKTLGDISPGLKKVEDYYLANISLELSKMEYTLETKELFDDYLKQLNELDKEYQTLLIELTNSGPNELTVNALIDNLKFRLNLLNRLKSQLNEF